MSNCRLPAENRLHSPRFQEQLSLFDFIVIWLAAPYIKSTRKIVERLFGFGFLNIINQVVLISNYRQRFTPGYSYTILMPGQGCVVLPGKV